MTGHDDQARPIPVGSGRSDPSAPPDPLATQRIPAGESPTAATPAAGSRNGHARAVPPTTVLPVIEPGPAAQLPGQDPYADWYAATEPAPHAPAPHAPAPHAPAPYAAAASAPAPPAAYRPSTSRGPAAPEPPVRPRRRRRVVRRTLLVLLVLLLGAGGYLVYVPWSAWQRVERVDATPAQRPSVGKGKNYLLVGSDSREGLTAAEADALGADTENVGKRTDTIMLVHVSENGGKPVVVSLPRDSYVAIPGNGTNKINAAFAFGGAKLLTQTVELATGLRIDGYLEIGFAGFAGVVDSLGGVQICVQRAMKDAFSGLDVQAGCQTMNGKTALAYVRARHSDPKGDLGRAERQRQFLAAVTKQAASLDTIVNPPRYTGFADAAAKGIIVGSTTSLADAVAVLRALRAVGNGEGVSAQVPVENPAYQTKNAGVAVKWNDAQAKAMFAQLRTDQPVSVPAG